MANSILDTYVLPKVFSLHRFDSGKNKHCYVLHTKSKHLTRQTKLFLIRIRSIQDLIANMRRSEVSSQVLIFEKYFVIYMCMCVCVCVCAYVCVLYTLYIHMLYRYT